MRRVLDEKVNIVIFTLPEDRDFAERLIKKSTLDVNILCNKALNPYIEKLQNNIAIFVMRKGHVFDIYIPIDGDLKFSEDYYKIIYEKYY